MSDDEDDKTPIIDEGLTGRAAQIDWSLHTGPENVVECIAGHGKFASHAKFDMVTEMIVSRKACPVCHSHRMRSSSIPWHEG